MKTVKVLKERKIADRTALGAFLPNESSSMIGGLVFEASFLLQIQRVLAIPGKIGSNREVQFLTRNEIKAILAAPDLRTWVGRRDYVLMLTAVPTRCAFPNSSGLIEAPSLLEWAHTFGKGRKERTTPITKMLNAKLKAWLDEPPMRNSNALFPTIHGERMSPDAVQYLLAKYVLAASKGCPSLRSKRISLHVLRHSAAMELLDAGVDSTVISLWLGQRRPLLPRSIRTMISRMGASGLATNSWLSSINSDP
ncbi:tyrosine-type recombinase/integrase [Rhizobium sp. NZLR1b]|uniref:tyrosine-type recombinase/integrase n=2 Tax=unclassified Rhizobium TaxID=2613769 RepID=UPI002180AF20|nr:tyrosine-type recombinase/integrase [Rhizobium sp. NZLR1b]